jgi:hypothetical protein
LTPADIPTNLRKSAAMNRLKDGHRVWDKTIDRCNRWRDRDNFQSNLTSERVVPICCDDGENVVGFMPAAPYEDFCEESFDPDSLACTITTIETFLRDPDRIIDADMAFDASVAWFAGYRQASCASSSKYDLFDAASHESGHALGLDHVRNPDMLMYPEANSCFAALRTLGLGDMRGLRHLY